MFHYFFVKSENPAPVKFCTRICIIGVNLFREDPNMEWFIAFCGNMFKYSCLDINPNMVIHLEVMWSYAPEAILWEYVLVKGHSLYWPHCNHYTLTTNSSKTRFRSISVLDSKHSLRKDC